MMTLSKALNASQAQKYYDAEYTNSRESYYSEYPETQFALLAWR